MSPVLISRRAAGRAGVLMIEQGGRGGVSDYTAQLSVALSEHDVKVDLATATDHLYELPRRVEVHRVFRYQRADTVLGRDPRLRRIVNGLRFLGAVPRLMRLAAGARVAHVQGWEHDGLGLLATGALRLAGTPVIFTPHNTFARGRAQPLASSLVKRLAARIIVHARADLPNLADDERERAIVIHHGEYGALARAGGIVDREAARRELGIGVDRPVALLFGQMREDKGVADLLTAAAAVENLVVLLAGKDLGALAAARPQIEAPGLAGRVIVREGFLTMEQAAPCFAAADAVVLPYRVASQSGVLLLAYGFHRAVVAYPVGGLAEAVIDGETGWLAAQPTPGALADALGSMAAAGWAECRRRGEAGARLAAEEYAWPAIAGRTAEVYERAAPGTTTAPHAPQEGLRP